MAIYKTFTSSSVSLTSFVNAVSRTLTTESVSRHQFLSGSDNATARSYYDSLRSMFYLSGSKMAETETRFQQPQLTLVQNFLHKNFHTQKFHKTGSIISIPTKQFGDTIKRKSLEIVDNSTAKTVILKDDGYGNLYAASASVSQSATDPSSSLNYVGNVFYTDGLVTITETGSWSSSIDYTDITSGNYTVAFEALNTIYTNSWTCNVKPTEYNWSNNPTLRARESASVRFTDIDRSPRAKPFTTGSTFTTFVTEIGLCNDVGEVMAVGKLSQPVKIRKDIDYFFKVKLDT
tara:strand:+ start:1860 stop:2729 length:870 start_codon:yes stop_codon:yes gene_type:complete